MLKTIRFKKKSSNCPVKIGQGLFKKFLKDLIKIPSNKYILIDAKVYKNFKDYFDNYKNKDLFFIKINASEKIKSIDTYWKIISYLLSKKIDRSSWIIVVGGGTIGDLGGFIASTILRGVKFVLIPSTLLSQVDSSIGGKNGINSKFGKNLIGTFYQPNLVIIDPCFLKYLSSKQLKEGYAEIVKHAIISDKIFYKWLKNNFNDLFKLKIKTIIYALEKSIKIKAKFVTNDERETIKNSSSRAMLNFGHTFGHALESMNNYKSTLTHGEAISIGMIIAAKISYKIGNISIYQLEDIIGHFKACGLPIKSNLIKKNKFYKLIMSDKKNENKKINIILLNAIGRAYYARNIKLKDIRSLISQTN